MKAADIGCVVLASGHSIRFGEGDKLSANLCGKSVLSHVLQTTHAVGFGQIFCVVKSGFLQIDPDVTWIENETSEAGQGNSLRLGLRALRQSGWTSCVILLGDMPLITSRYLKSMINKTEINQSSISNYQTTRMPPALFCLDVIDEILALRPSTGAREIIDSLKLVTMNLEADAALDVDTPEDLARVTRIMESRKT